jgi:hypothetical protein
MRTYNDDFMTSTTQLFLSRVIMVMFMRLKSVSKFVFGVDLSMNVMHLM